ncbi:MAG: AraC family transcriptional regulator, partial [Mixta calida]|nr:AraC family transcriptional regulator [Mixta calida]
MSHDEILMIKVLIIIPEGGMLFEAAGIAEILSHASRTGRFTGGGEAYQVSITAGKSNTAGKGFSGIRLSVNHHLSDLSVNAGWDTIIVTGRGMDKDERRLIANWLRQAEPYARRVVSICGGSLLLAESGLLDGRKATTHWQLLDVLKTGFPNVKVDEDSIYTRDGKIWTSAGVSAGFDLTLALIEEDYGFQHARSVAQDMVMFLKRPGGQSQFSRYVVNQAVQPGPVHDL